VSAVKTRDRSICQPTNIIGKYLTSNIGMGFKKVVSKMVSKIRRLIKTPADASYVTGPKGL